jgi:hypothetical protein
MLTAKQPKASPGPPALCTRDDVKTFLGLSDDLSDATIDLLIPGVTAQLLNAINRLDLMPAVDYTDYIAGPGAPKLYLKHYPVNQIEEVTIGGEVISEFDPDAPEAGGWRFFANEPNPENRQFIELMGFIYGEPCCCCWPQPQTNLPNIVVTYNAGYPNVPAALNQAAIEWVAFKRNMSQVQSANPTTGAQQIGDYSEGGGGIARVAIDYMGIEIPSGVIDVIDQYRRWVV